MYGQINEDKSNVILVLHALSGDAHAAGYHSPQEKRPGWWDAMIGPGKAFDTNLYCVISTNVLGGCQGTTGPSSVNPKTGQVYNLAFPVISIKDMVKVQKKLLEHFDIHSLLCVTGGSMGGMQVLEWVVSHSEMIRGAIPMAFTSRLSPQSIAFNEVGRRAIMGDPKWNNGDYDPKDPPAKGLEIARMLGHITYLSEESMQLKFGRRLRDNERYAYGFNTEFEVESYLKYQGESFVKRFDANSYLYITRALDYFDIARDTGGSLEVLFKNVNAKFLILSFSTDWLFPPAQSKEIAKALRAVDKEVSYVEIESNLGHDAFLIEHEKITPYVKYFLENLSQHDEK